MRLAERRESAPLRVEWCGSGGGSHPVATAGRCGRAAGGGPARQAASPASGPALPHPDGRQAPWQGVLPALLSEECYRPMPASA